MKYLKTFESLNNEEEDRIYNAVNTAFEENLAGIFDMIGMDMPRELEGEEYEQIMDEARNKAMTFFGDNPDLLKEL